MSENPNLDENGHWIGTAGSADPPAPVLDERGDWAGVGKSDKPPVMILDENGGFIGTYADFAAEEASPRPRRTRTRPPAAVEGEAEAAD